MRETGDLNQRTYLNNMYFMNLNVFAIQLFVAE